MQKNLQFSLKKNRKRLILSVSKHIQSWVFLTFIAFLSLFFFSFLSSLCLEFQNRVWQRKWDSDVLFSGLQLLSLADGVHRV